MTTWRMFRALLDPPVEHPLFVRIKAAGGMDIPWYTGCAELVAFVLIVPMLLATSAAYSIGWAVGISGQIARARADGWYDLLALSPIGPSGVRRLIALATIHRSSNFTQISGRSTWTGRLVVVGLLLMFGASPAVAETGSAAPALVGLLALVGAMLIDHAQSIVLGVLIGMAAPSFSDDVWTVQLGAFAAFVLIQTFTYGLAFAVTFLMLPDLLASTGLSEVAATMLRFILGLVVLALPREILIALLGRGFNQ